MSETKFTKDGKKVVVVGKLNNEQWIVQEIFVANGKEFPGGENFVVKTLLDKPAETWQDREEKRLERRTEELKSEIDSLSSKRDISQREAKVTAEIDHCAKQHGQAAVDELQTLMDFISGKITHVLRETYSDYEIKTLQDALMDIDCGWGKRFGGLKLVSLFGVNEYGKRHGGKPEIRMDWRLNQYRDGSGSDTIIYPCKSHKAAVEKMDELLAAQEKARDGHVELKKKYGLKNPTQAKINDLKKRNRKAAKDRIKTITTDLNKQETLLKDLSN